MPNNREKGKVIERWFVNNGLKDIFPNIRRNAGEQSQSGGRDLENTPGFCFEVKGGKAYKSIMIRKCIEQAQAESREQEIPVVLMKPDREESYVVIRYVDFLVLLRDGPLL